MSNNLQGAELINSLGSDYLVTPVIFGHEYFENEKRDRFWCP